MDAEKAYGILKFEKKRLQHAFSKHKVDFGVTENWNNESALRFEKNLTKHINKVEPIWGTYRGKGPVLHYFDKITGLNVMLDVDGYLVGAWKLSEDQIKYLLLNGSVK